MSFLHRVNGKTFRSNLLTLLWFSCFQNLSYFFCIALFSTDSIARRVSLHIGLTRCEIAVLLTVLSAVSQQLK